MTLEEYSGEPCWPLGGYSTRLMVRSMPKRSMVPKVSVFIFSLTLILLGGILKSPSGMAADQGTVDKAKKEGGEVLVHSVMTLDFTKPLWDAFEKHYPFLKVHQYRARTQTMVTRLLNEYRAGVYSADVLTFNDAEFELLRANRIVESYLSSESKHFPSVFRDTGRYWTAIHFVPFSIIYNTKLVSEAEKPRGWTDLLISKWRDRIGMERYNINWYGNMLLALGEKQGRLFMQDLAKQKPRPHDGTTLLLQQVIWGELPLAIGRGQHTEAAKLSGAPVDWVKDINPMLAQFHVVGLARSAPHPNSARLLIDFLLSGEAQVIVAESARIPTREGIKKSPGFESINISKLIPPDPRIREKYNDYMGEYKNLFWK